jgi:hypothetical protein
MSNVYAKLQKCRVDLAKMNINKTGENKFAGYQYFELGDFMIPINEMFAEVGLFGHVSFTPETASLTIINTEKPDETILFTSPMAAANLKGCHDIQNMGAVETYQRRYLYVMALEIVEHDVLDATTGKEAPQETEKAPASNQNKQYYAQEPAKQQAPQTQSQTPPRQAEYITDKQVGFLMGLIKRHGVDAMELKDAFQLASSKDILKSQWKEICAWVESGGGRADDDMPF